MPHNLSINDGDKRNIEHSGSSQGFDDTMFGVLTERMVRKGGLGDLGDRICIRCGFISDIHRYLVAELTKDGGNHSSHTELHNLKKPLNRQR